MTLFPLNNVRNYYLIFGSILCLLIISSEYIESTHFYYNLYQNASSIPEEKVPFIHSILPMHDCDGHHESASLKYIPTKNASGAEVLMPSVEALLPYCPLADGFDMPVGAPNARGYYIAQIFGKNRHMGEDWNAKGGSHLDFGKPVHAVANGVVHWAIENKGSWGNFIRVLHNIGTAEKPRYIETFYAHLEHMDVKSGDIVYRGQQIGTIGDADGKYNPHLHFEMKLKVGTEVGRGYGEDPKIAGHIPPYPFIAARRPHNYIQGR